MVTCQICMNNCMDEPMLKKYLCRFHAHRKNAKENKIKKNDLLVENCSFGREPSLNNLKPTGNG